MMSGLEKRTNHGNEGAPTNVRDYIFLDRHFRRTAKKEKEGPEWNMAFKHTPYYVRPV